MNIMNSCYHPLLSGEGREGEKKERKKVKVLHSNPVKTLRSSSRVLSKQVSLMFQESHLIDAGKVSLILNVEVKIKQRQSEQSAYTNC